MEELNAYIESGILERYVLGELTAAERLEVESMAASHDDVRKELYAIEVALEQYALAGAIEPSENSLKNIMAALGQDADSANSVEPQPVQHLNTESVTLFPVKVKRLQYSLAACAALLIASAVTVISLHNKLKYTENQLLSLRIEKDKFAAKAKYLEQSNSELQETADMIDDPNWAIVRLAGTKVSPKSKMMVYWNRKSDRVVVDKSRMDLPANDLRHQYQLWAIVSGKPVDLGVFDMKADSAQMLVIMKKISEAQAFAVTLEKRGGSVDPTMENLIAMGGVSPK